MEEEDIDVEEQACDEEEEMFVDIESDELDGPVLIGDASLVTVPADTTTTTTQYFEVSSSTVVSESDGISVVLISSGSATPVHDSDEVVVLTSSTCEHTTSDSETSSVGPSKTAPVCPRNETNNTVSLHTPTLHVDKHMDSDSVKFADLSQASLTSLQKLASYSGLKDLRVVLTRVETASISSSCRSISQQDGTELSLAPSTSADESFCHDIGLKRPLIGGRDSGEGSPLKQQKIEDSSLLLSHVTCDQMSGTRVFTTQPSVELRSTNAVEKTDFNESIHEVTGLPTDSAENVTIVGQSVVDGVSAMKDAIADAIADVILMSDSSPLADNLPYPASASNTVHLSAMDNDNPEQKVYNLLHNSDFITLEDDDKTDGQPAIDKVSSLNDAIADAIANVSAVSDNSLIVDIVASTESEHCLVTDEASSMNDAIADAIADVIATNDNPIAPDSSSSAAVNRTRMLSADSDTPQKVTETLSTDVVTGSRPVTRSAKRAPVLPPPPSVTNAGSKMRMRMEAANQEKPSNEKRPPSSIADRKSIWTRWSPIVEATTAASSVDTAAIAQAARDWAEQQTAAASNTDGRQDSSSGEKPTSELSDWQGKGTQEWSRLADEKEVEPVMDWRPPPTKSAGLKDHAMSSIPTIMSGTTISDSDTNWRTPPNMTRDVDMRQPPTRSSAPRPSTPSTTVASLLDWKPPLTWTPGSAPIETGQWSEGSTESCIVPPLQSPSPFCAPPPNVTTHDVDMRQPPPNIPVPVPGQIAVIDMSQPPPSVPPSNVQLQNASLAPVVARPPGVPAVVASSPMSGGPVPVNHGQPPPQMGPGPICPPPVIPPPAVAPLGVVPSPGGQSVSPGVVQPPAHTPPHMPPTNQPPPSMSFSQPPTVVPVPGPSASPQPHVGSSPGQPGLAHPVVAVTQPPPQIPPAVSGSQPLLLPTPNALPQSHVGLSPGQPVPPAVAAPVTPVAQPPPQMALAAPSPSKPPLIGTRPSLLGTGPVRPPPTNATFGPNQPPQPNVAGPPPQMAPPGYHHPPQQFGPSREPPPPGVGPVPPPGMGPPGMFPPGPMYPPPQWGPRPMPPPQGPPPMWGPHPQGVPPPGFGQPYPGVHHHAGPPEWGPPPPGAPYMQPGMPGPGWRPPMNYPPPHDGGWWPPPAAGMPHWGPAQVPPSDWSQPQNTGAVPPDAGGSASAVSGSGDGDTTAVAQAAKEWADWQQRYTEWYYKYYGSGAVPASTASTAAVAATDTDMRQQNTRNQQKMSAAPSSAPTPAPVRAVAANRDAKVSKSSAPPPSTASAIPLPAKQQPPPKQEPLKPTQELAKPGTAAAFAKFAEKAASNINFVLGVYGSNPQQNVFDKSKTPSTNIQSKPSEGEYLLFLLILNLTYTPQ